MARSSPEEREYCPGGAALDPSCLDHVLTDDERAEFDRTGLFVVEDAIAPPMVAELNVVVDRIDSAHRSEQGMGPHERVQLSDYIGRDDVFLDLLDWHKTFPKVWGILGWHIQLYHTHLAISPPFDPSVELMKKGWHQDSGRLNTDLESDPRPRISLKVAYFLTDTTELGRANFYVVPGSHLKNSIDVPSDGSDPEGATPVRVGPGTAVFFDRRLWHSATANLSDVPRKVLFYGYSYRWLRPRDNMTVSHLMERSDPIRRQLLGASSGGLGFTSPTEDEVPLKAWLREHLGEDAAVA